MSPMRNIFSKAIDKFGTAEFSRWLLPDGTFLGVPDYEDHRIVSQFCKERWTEFLYEGAVSVHYDSRAGYMWIRTVGGYMTGQQRQAFRCAFEEFNLRVEDLKVDAWDDNGNVDETLLTGQLAELFLTDRIAYELEKQYADTGE